MEKSIGKSVFSGGLKAGLFSLIFSCIGVLLLALVAKLFALPDSVLPVVNQVVKALSVALGTAIAVKDEKFLAKSLVGSVVFWVLSSLLFSILGGSFHFGQIALDLGVSVVVALVVALLKSRRA